MLPFDSEIKLLNFHIKSIKMKQYALYMFFENILML